MWTFRRFLVTVVVVLLATMEGSQAGEMKHNEIDSSRACACTWTTVADYEGRLQHSHDSNDILKKLLSGDGVEEDRVKQLEKLAKKLAYSMPYQRQYDQAIAQGMAPPPFRQQADDDTSQGGGQQTPFALPRGAMGGYAPYGYGNNVNAMYQRRDMEDMIRRIVRETPPMEN